MTDGVSKQKAAINSSSRLSPSEQEQTEDHQLIIDIMEGTGTGIKRSDYSNRRAGNGGFPAGPGGKCGKPAGDAE